MGPVDRCLIQTERLNLAPITSADVATLVRHWSDETVRQYLWGDSPIDIEAVSQVVHTSDNDFDLHGHGLWALRGEGNSLIGVCGLRGNQELEWPELLYSLKPRFWGKGLAKEAATAVLQHAFESLNAQRIVARKDADNLASNKVLRGLGMLTLNRPGGSLYVSVTPARFRAMVSD